MMAHQFLQPINFRDLVVALPGVLPPQVVWSACPVAAVLLYVERVSLGESIVGAGMGVAGVAAVVFGTVGRVVEVVLGNIGLAVECAVEATRCGLMGLGFIASTHAGKVAILCAMAYGGAWLWNWYKNRVYYAGRALQKYVQSDAEDVPMLMDVPYYTDDGVEFRPIIEEDQTFLMPHTKGEKLQRKPKIKRNSTFIKGALEYARRKTMGLPKLSEANMMLTDRAFEDYADTYPNLRRTDREYGKGVFRKLIFMPTKTDIEVAKLLNTQKFRTRVAKAKVAVTAY